MNKIEGVVATAGLYLASGVLSLGVSQTIGLIGLSYIGSKSLINKIRIVYYNFQATHQFIRSVSLDYEKKVVRLESELSRSAQTAKTLGLLLLPVTGAATAFHYGDIGGTVQAFAAESLIPFETRAQRLVYQNFYPGRLSPEGRPTNIEDFEKEEILEALEGKAISILTSDNRSLEAIYVPGENAQPNGVTVVLHHANAMISYDMHEYAQFYKEQGVNVLMVTMGGYQGSEGVGSEKNQTTELSTYLDAQASIDYVRRAYKVKAEHIISHGISIGSTLACQAGQANPGVNVIAENAFTSATDAARAVVGNHMGKGVAPFAAGAVEVGFGKKEEYSILEDYDELIAKKIATDGLNNQAKVKQINGKFLAIGAEKDKMMTYPDKQTGKTRNFAEDLAESYVNSHSNKEVKDHIVLIPQKGHHARSIHYDDSKNKIIELIDQIRR